MSKQALTMVVDLDERGVFKAHVDDDKGRTVFELSTEDDEEGVLWLVQPKSEWMRLYGIDPNKP